MNTELQPKVTDRIVCVKVGKWKYTQVPQYEGRCEFEGVEDVNSEYIGKSVSAFYGKSQNPVKYINM